LTSRYSGLPAPPSASAPPVLAPSEAGDSGPPCYTLHSAATLSYPGIAPCPTLTATIMGNLNPGHHSPAQPPPPPPSLHTRTSTIPCVCIQPHYSPRRGEQELDETVKFFKTPTHVWRYIDPEGVVGKSERVSATLQFAGILCSLCALCPVVCALTPIPFRIADCGHGEDDAFPH
jgi:hypothetical protein